MTSCIVVGDVHQSDRAPSIRTETYTQDINDKLGWISCYAYDKGYDFILQLGDVFHVKTPSRNSHALVVSTHEALTRGGLPVVIVAGNHDLMYDRLESVPSQPLGALAKMEGITLLEGWHDTFPVFGIPYLADWSTLPDWLDIYNITLGNVPTLYGDVIPLVATHAPLFPPGEEPIYDSIDPADWAKFQTKGSVSYGHIHDPHGAYTVNGVQFANFGAISRGSLHKETLKRKPQVAGYDFSTGKYTAIPVPHKPFEEVFKMEEHNSEVSKKQKLASFLDGLNSGTLDITTVEKVIADLESMDIPAATKAVARELVEGAYAKL